jgi:epoxyqueuosine reductase
LDLLKAQYGEFIRQKSVELGFDDCGFAKAQELSLDKEHVRNWLNNNMHANMHYMANHFEKRVDPSKLVEGAKTVIVLLTNYFPKEKYSSEDSLKIARYAWGKDYHYVLKDKLNTLFNFIKTEIYPALEGRCFVDSAPVLERSLAVQAGLGWIGKNSNLIHKRLGSYVFISELIINLDLPDSAPVREACGGCTRCMDACPTNAIVSDRVVDARRCISYLTIENKEEIPEEFSGKMNNRIFGCDICQEVCPWTWKSRPHHLEEFHPNKDFLNFTHHDWLELSEQQFAEVFKKSAVKRTKFSGLKRNIDFIFQKK